MEQVIHRARITYKLGRGFTRPFPAPCTYMTMRDRLDAFLVERAVDAGAAVMDGFPVRRVEVEHGHARVYSDGDSVTGSILVGADGANSVVAHQLGLVRDTEMLVGLESEVYADGARQERWRSTVGLDFGTLRGGYMWVFPKADHLSIGVGGFTRHSTLLRGLMDRFLASLDLGPHERRLTRGHRLPRRRPGSPIQRGRALLVGDAAGLVDFWTGEGIYSAIRSAQLASDAIPELLEGTTTDLGAYERRVDEELMPDLKVARTMARIGALAPHLVYSLMKRSDRAWNAGCRILVGDRSYHDSRLRLGPFWGTLFDLAGVGT